MYFPVPKPIQIEVSMEPSKEAIEQCHKLWRELWLEWWNGGRPDYTDAYQVSLDQTERILKRFIEIDFAALQQALREAQAEVRRFSERLQAEVEQRDAEINELLVAHRNKDIQLAELQAENTGWKQLHNADEACINSQLSKIKGLEAENERLKEQVAKYKSFAEDQDNLLNEIERLKSELARHKGGA